MNPLEKIHVLDEIEKEIILCLQSAGKGYENSSVSKINLMCLKVLRYKSSVKRSRRRKMPKLRLSNSQNLCQMWK